MTTRYRHRRTSDPTIAFPTPIEPGEIAVNTSNRQIAVGDSDPASVGVPTVLLAVRIFDARGKYLVGEYVTQGGFLYRCKAPHGPLAFNPAHFEQLLGVDSISVPSADVVTNTPAGNIAATNVQAALNELDAEKVAKAGDTMSGLLVLSGDPAAPAGAATKNYVDNQIAADLALIANKVAKAGDTMTGPLTLPGDPGANLQAATKQYVDNNVRTPATAAPLMDAAAVVGVATKYAREDHVHPTDTSRAAVAALPVAATAAEFISNSAPTKMLTPGAPWTAAVPVALVDGATVTPDFSAAIDFIWTMTSTGRTLANPTGIKPGQKGMIYLVQDASAPRTIGAWGSAYKFPGGTKPTLSILPGAVDVISYAAKSATEVECFFAAGMA
jgi:hypothetical protein